MIVTLCSVRWRLVHYDPVREILTLERDRRWYRGAYVVMIAIHPDR